MAEWLNTWSAQFAYENRDCIHTATFFPEPTAAGYVRRALADGARVFKAHVQVGDYSPTDQQLEPVWFTDFTKGMHPFPRAAFTDLRTLADKVLFGSDFRNIPYSYHHAIESITRLGLGDEWCRKVLYTNALELFH